MSRLRLGLVRLLTQSASADADAERIDAALATLKRAQSLLDGDDATPDQRPTVMQLEVRLLGQTADAAGRLRETQGSDRDLEFGDPAARAPHRRSQPGLGFARTTERHSPPGRRQPTLRWARRPKRSRIVRPALEVRRAMLEERPANLANRLTQSSVCVGSPESRATWGGSRGRSRLYARPGPPRIGSRREPAQRPRAQEPDSQLARYRRRTLQAGPCRGKPGKLRAEGADPGGVGPDRAAGDRAIAPTSPVTFTTSPCFGKPSASLRPHSMRTSRPWRSAARWPRNSPTSRFTASRSPRRWATSGGASWWRNTTMRRPWRTTARQVLCSRSWRARYPDVAEYSEYLSRTRTNLASILTKLGQFDEALAVDQAAEPYLERRVRAAARARAGKARFRIQSRSTVRILPLAPPLR